MKCSFYLILIAMVACGGSVPEAPPQQVEAPKPPDQSRRFPKDGQTAMELVNDNLLGKDFLPGGNLATYEKDGKTYQMFLIVSKTPDTAAALSFDAKEQLQDSKFVPSFGGYFGMDGETPWFIFSKTNHLLGVVGLPQEEADLVARDFAARVQ
jgi:hypothetical protein